MMDTLEVLRNHVEARAFGGGVCGQAEYELVVEPLVAVVYGGTLGQVDELLRISCVL